MPPGRSNDAAMTLPRRSPVRLNGPPQFDIGHGAVALQPLL